MQKPLPKNKVAPEMAITTFCFRIDRKLLKKVKATAKAQHYTAASFTRKTLEEAVA